ncbi:dehydratase [Desulfosarcina alkanivorans]|uniref:Dehydratase n=1 Tax=Desulfosarcina alkanivorans TaxID=571177 RepID=A0A5K7YMR6_9BACT|nr:MaoC family dehydratase [Desulfosarcina alkanivorans]BBO69723.1 dehydratase [Desulfosarcina alkanivorans]
MFYEKGKSYDVLEVGEKASFSKTITESDIYIFAGISGDFNPMHVNEAYARQTRFKTRIAHGPLSQSLIAPVLGTKLPGLGTVALELFSRFKAPVYIGDTITASAQVSEKLQDKRWVRLKLTWVNQKNELVAEGTALVMPPT